MNTLQNVENDTIPKSLLLASCKVETMFWSSNVFTTSNLPYQYHFGMPMPGRNMNNGDYRFGFNGMEKDDEIKGSGNSYTTEFRQLDPRLGRWLSLDPLMAKYPHQSPYAAFNDNPIYFADPTGLEGDPPGEELSAENKKFFSDVKGFIDNQIKSYETKITNLEASYKKKNWAIDKSKGKFKVYADRISELKSYKSDVEAIETAVTTSGGDDLLTLMNVVHNEAGNYGSSAKTAVAYAYLNRIGYKEGGDIREPVNGSEISHYSKLGDRWSGFSTTAEKLEFLGSIKSSFDAANTRYSRKGTDPTGGATHWVSPMGLVNSPRAGYYQRTYDGISTYFPNWARSNEWVKKNPTQAKKWFDVANYKEIKATGVSGKEFLFYKGVKY